MNVGSRGILVRRDKHVTKFLKAGILLCALTFPAIARAQTWVSVDFQDTLPFTAAFHTASDPTGNLADVRPPGACANGVYWNYGRVAPGAGNGGYNNRGYARYTWCDYDVSRAGDQSDLAGWQVGSGYRFEPGGTGLAGRNAWPDTFYGRIRVYIETPMTVAAGGDGDRQLKFFVWHQSVYDGDQRVIGFLESGQNCGQSNPTHVCFTLQRNINHYTDSATVALATGTWHHLQFAWRHGASGVSFVKVWKDNNNASSPTAQDLSLTGIPSRPGGTSTWVKDHAGYDQPFALGNGANNGTRFSENFMFRMMDLQLGGSFDGAWYPGGSAQPTAPRNLRVLPPE